MSSDTSGSLLVETLVALALLATALVAVSAMLVAGKRNQLSAGDLGHATTLAVGKSEELQGAALAALATGEDRTRRGPTFFDRTWTIERDLPHAGLTTVTVRVVSRGPKRAGDPASITLRFYRAR